MKENKSIKIQFLGAAGTVTGSKYLIDYEGTRLLIDCGMFQGLKKLRLLNWQPLDISTHKINAVLLTHGHLDHCGFLPRLMKYGFDNPIYGTAPTLEIAKIILEDSAKIQEEEAERANKKGYSKHSPARPLYDLEDVEKTLKNFRPVELNNWLELGDNIRARFNYNGHIIGATFIELELGDKTIVFSGDIGQTEDVLMRPPERPDKADILFIESTYGDRLHSAEPAEDQLAKVVNDTVAQKGVLIIPSFAVERTQVLMYLLWQLLKKGRIPKLPMIMDSPMGANVLNVFDKFSEWHKLSKEECTEMCNLFQIVKSYKETQKLIKNEEPKIVIAGSGMVGGGRVLGYLEKYISRPETTVLLAGYQAEGTRGRALFEGTPEIKFYGEYHPVKANIEMMEGLSAHADQQELIDWMSSIKNTPEKVFIVHGEPQAADTLRVKIQDTYHWDCEIPEFNQISWF